MQLVGHLAIFHDRPDNKLREEEDIHRKRQEIFLRFDFARVDIDLIADDFKDVIADAQRQHRADIQGCNAKMSDLIQRVDQKVGILEIHQYSQVDQHRHGWQQTAQLSPGLGCQQRPQVVEHDKRCNQRQKFNAGPAVENQAFCQQHCIFGAAGHQIIQQQGKRQKAEQEHHTVKNHGVLPSFESC